MAKKRDEILPIDEARKRKKKKEQPLQSDNTALNKQVIEEDTLTIADVKDFITKAQEKQRDYRLIADRSWNEIEKRNKDGKLYGGQDLNKLKKWAKFPLWWSCLKIRQPITFAQLPEPILKDTQGDDPFGRTACVVGERLTKGILKTFEMFSEVSAANDDFLVTNFAWGRPFYRVEICEEDEKVRLQTIQPPPMPQGPEEEMMEPAQEVPPMEQQELPEPMPPMFVTPEGMPVDPSQVLNDEFGPYLLTGQKVEIENEEIYFEAGLYPDLLVDPKVHKWNKANELAFRYEYSYREFKEKFGKGAFDKIVQGDRQDHKDGKKPIIVYEYWNKFLRECRWLAENSEDFFQPKEIEALYPDDLEEVEYDNSDLYGLSGFFPCVEPLIINQSTKQFWPTPEYFQVSDIIEDIHSIVGRMIQLTKAIRVRFLFDSSVTQLASLIGENWAQGEGTGMGIPDLETTLMNNKGSLSSLVAYFPVDELIQGLNNMYTAFEQRLNMFYQITGISDLIRGQTNPDSDKTYGERQMEGKFALNRIEPYQYKIQEWIKNNYELMMEMGLKMFSDKTIDEYVTPQTLDEEDKQRYVAALELLKSNKRRRFRVDFETNSTVSINEQWRRQQAIETANIISKMQEAVAKTAQEMPELAESQLKIMQHVIGELTDGKLFFDEITKSIEDTIERVAQPKPPEFNADEAKAKLEEQRFMFEQQRAVFQDQLLQQKQTSDAQFKQIELQANNQLEIAKIQQQERFESFANQLAQIKMSNDAGLQSAELNQKAQALQADIALAQEELLAKRNEFLLQAQEIASKTEAKQLEMIMDARVSEQKKQLDELYFALDKQKMILDEREKYATEERLQAEHQLQVLTSVTELHKTMKEIENKPAPEMPPITVHVAAPAPTKRTRKAKIIRDAKGAATELLVEDDG